MTHYAEETKAAVMAALLAGQSISQAAREYKIPKGTVASWKQRDIPHATQKREIGDKLLALVNAQLDSALERVKLFGDRKWLEKQDAAELATLHGVDLDKTVRLLEALAGGSGED